MFAKKIGIDLGTATMQVYVRGEGIVLDEPSLAAVDAGGTNLLALGRQAIDLARQAPGAVRLVRPVRDGAIADPALVARMLLRLVTSAQGRQRLFRPEVMMCVPTAASGADRRALTEAAVAAGARQAWLIEAPLAAAMGLGLPVAERAPHAICDLGASAAQVAVISLSGVVASHGIAVGGEHLDAAIATHVLERHGLRIDRESAEAAKIAAGAALAVDDASGTEVTGSDPAGAARTVHLASVEVTEAMRTPLRAIAGAVRLALEQAPPRVAAAVAARGLFLTGGGALLRGIDRYLAAETGLSVRVADAPRTCAVRGTRRALGEFEVLQRRQLYLR